MIESIQGKCITLRKNKIHRMGERRISLPEPKEPNPGREGAIFLAWMLKIGQSVKLSKAEKEWARKKRDNPELRDMSLKDFIVQVGEEYIYETTWKGDKILRLTKEGIKWAEPWTFAHNVARGHHSQQSKRKLD